MTKLLAGGTKSALTILEQQDVSELALESADFDGMPWSAVATGSVDLIVPLEEIRATLLRLVGMPRPS